MSDKKPTIAHMMQNFGTPPTDEQRKAAREAELQVARYFKVGRRSV